MLIIRFILALLLLVINCHALAVETGLIKSNGVEIEKVPSKLSLKDSISEIYDQDLTPTKSIDEASEVKKAAAKLTTLQKPRQAIRPIPIILVPRKHKHRARKRCDDLSSCSKENNASLSIETSQPEKDSQLVEEFMTPSDDSFTRQVVFLKGAQHRSSREL